MDDGVIGFISQAKAMLAILNIHGSELSNDERRDIAEVLEDYIKIRARIDVLEAALKPFKARLGDRSAFEEAAYGKDYRAADSFEIYVPIGDLRNAAIALHPTADKP